MSSLKTLFVLAVLGAVAYAVYVTINKNPQTAAVPDEAPAWPGTAGAQPPGVGPPNVQVPASGVPNVQVPGFGPSSVPGAGSSGLGAPSVQFPNSGGYGVPGPGTSPGPAAAPGADGTPGAWPGASPSGAAPSFTMPENPPPPADASAGIASNPMNPLAPGGATAPVGPSGSAGGGPMVAVPATPYGSQETLATPSDRLAAEAGRLGNPTPDPTQQVGPRDGFAMYLENVHRKLDAGQLAEAHLELSRLHGDPNLTPQQARQVVDLLDQLAGTVIYSREHWLEGRPHLVQPGETLDQIAQRYDVPWQLLAKINGIRDSQNLPPGQQIKVVRGPFTAVVNLGSFELTMMLNGRYAGRFPIGIGTDRANLEGTYVVRDKTVNPHYYGPDRAEVAADDPNNPLGDLWIGLDDQVGIHGCSDPAAIGRSGGRGTICLGPQDIEDVFGILSIGSRVVIRR